MKNDLFEARLISYLSSINLIQNDYDRLASVLSSRTGRNVNGRQIVFMSRGDSFAKKWLLTALFELSLENNWLPNSLQDWENVIWTITGKKQSALGGDNSKIYQKLADITGKPEIIFENNFNQCIGVL